MLRAGPVVEILPKAPFEGAHAVVAVTTHEPKATSGLLKFARLKALNMSAWNRKLNRSVRRNCLRIEKSQVCRFGPVTIPTGALPRRPKGAGAKTAGLIQPSGPGLDRSTGPPR